MIVVIADQLVTGGIVAAGVAVIGGLAGRHLSDPRPAREEVTPAAAGVTGPPALPPAACPGRLTLHEDGSTSCHGGRDDCWGGAGYRHDAPIACAAVSHGCGRCQTAGWAS